MNQYSSELQARIDKLRKEANQIIIENKLTAEQTRGVIERTDALIREAVLNEGRIQNTEMEAEFKKAA